MADTNITRRLKRLLLALAALCAGMGAANAQTSNPPASPSAHQQTPPVAQPQAPAPQQTPPPAPQTQPPPPADAENAAREIGAKVNAALGDWKNEHDRIERELAKEGIRYTELDRYRAEADGLRQRIEQFQGELRPRLDAIKGQAERLGPPPQPGQPPEPEAVARQRAETGRLMGDLSGALNAADAARHRSIQIIANIQEIRRRIFTGRLFRQTPGALSPAVWMEAPANARESVARASIYVERWWAGLDNKGEVIQIAVLSLLLFLGLSVAARRGILHFRAWSDAEDPPFWRRASSAAWVILLRALPVAAAAALLYWGLNALDPLPQRIDRLLYAGLRAIVIVVLVRALITTVLAPGRPKWRLFPASSWSAYRIQFLVIALACVFAGNAFLGTLSRVGEAPFSFTIVIHVISSLAFAALVIAILRTRLDNQTEIEGAPELGWLRALRIPLWIAAIAIIASALLGYVGLARFISAQLILTGAILALVYLMMVWADAFGQSVADSEASTGGWLKATFGLEQSKREQIAWPITLLLKFIVLLLAVPLIMLQWGFDWRDVTDWLRNLFFGFQVGDTQISIAAIIASVIVFIIGYFAAKLFQGWLDRQVLKPSGISHSARDSIRTGVGYLGVFAAGLFAFSYAGIDLSNLAIIAGAFSVGIGFGLQAVISNFVSGLILLAERPIKVGDWVVVGGEEGLVKRISVRSTEIETFDRSTVLVPNSYFVTETVKNWTLRDSTGRVVIDVGVDYGSDPAQVRDILLKVARDNGYVMSDPAPLVYFEDFGSDALNFKLYLYLYNMNSSLSVRTDIRIAILKAFREAGIDMPYRQTDVHLRNMDWLKDAVTNYMETRGGGAAAASASASTARPGNGVK